MQCAKFDARMHDLLDRRERPAIDPVLQDHAQTCERCAEQLAAQAAMLSGLSQMETPGLPADFARRVLAARHAPRKRGPLGNRAMTLIALAAVLLLALLPAWWLLRQAERGDRESGIGTSVASDPGRQRPANRPVPPSLAGIKRPPGDVGHHRETQAAPDQPVAPGQIPPPREPTVDQVVAPGEPRGSLLEPYTGLVPTLDDLPWRLPRHMVAVDDEQAEILKEIWVDQVATPLQPVTNSVTAAIDVVRQTLAISPAGQPDDVGEDQPQARGWTRPHRENLA